MGETDNKGTPKTEAEIAYGRTMPRKDADYPIRGYEYYDFTAPCGEYQVRQFCRTMPLARPERISYLLYTSFPISTNNDVEGLKFENAKPVYFPPQQDRRWSFSGEFGSFAGWNGAVFHDIDGSVGGVPDSYIVIDNGIADDDKACQIKPDWNAAVCKGDFGRMQIGAGGAGGRGGPVAVLALPEVAGGPGALPLLALLQVLAQLAVLAPLEVVAELAVEEPLLHRSFSAAMAGNLPSTGTPRYSPVPRSGRKAKRRP